MNVQTHLLKNIEKSSLCIHKFISKQVDKNLLGDILDKKIKLFSNKNIDYFFQNFSQLLNSQSKKVILDDTIGIELEFNDYNIIEQSLNGLSPWRKGPFQISDIFIDSEWQSFMKWNRFKSYWTHLEDKKILDIGCGNGYYMFRMLAHNPKFVLGIDPSNLTYFQFHSIQHFINDNRLSYLPIGWADLHPFSKCFDIVSCMGILYHNRSPIDLLITAKSVLKNNGKLFLETLIIQGEDDVALFPKDRYAGMPNVYFLPTVNCLKNMLNRVGFKHIDILSIDQTTEEEQRPTKWSTPVSLGHYLDPKNNHQTTEGYPAPIRIALVCY